MKKIFVLLTFSMIFSLSIPIFAKTDKEILFRDIPWGSSVTSVVNHERDYDLYYNDNEYSHTYNTGEAIIYGKEEAKKDESVIFGINMNDQQVNIAGYECDNIYMSFVYKPFKGKLPRHLNDTALFYAFYNWGHVGHYVLNNMVSDLEKKLIELYGEPDQTDIIDDPNYSNPEYAKVVLEEKWFGANDTAVILHSYEYIHPDNDYGGDVTISYVTSQVDPIIIEADSIAKEELKNQQEENSKSTDGL